MDRVTYEKMVAATVEELRELSRVKGGEYSGDVDALENFKRGAGLTGATPMQVCFIYLAKHYDGIASFIKDDATGESRPRSEGVVGRLHDLINYCLLLKGLVLEQEALREVEKQALPIYANELHVWSADGQHGVIRNELEVESFLLRVGRRNDKLPFEYEGHELKAWGYRDDYSKSLSLAPLNYSTTLPLDIA